jgi:parallel beta-helix repeat protein
MVVSDGDSNTVSDNVIYGNHDTGINVKTGAANTKLYFNTIYNNAGLVDGGGIHIGSGITGTIAKNNVMSTNGGGDWVDNGTGTVSDYNETKDATGIGAHTLINSDPLFVGAATNNFHLQATSPAKGAGIAIALVPTDFDGVTRPNPPSIGAYDFLTVPSARTLRMTSYYQTGW